MSNYQVKYNFKLALKNLGYRTGLTSLIIASIGIGLGMLMTIVTMSYQAKKVPLPELSDKLYLVQLDSREMEAREVTEQIDMINLTYRDATNLYKAHTIATKQTFNFKVNPILAVDDRNTRPIRAMADATTASFFELFQAPFLFGKPWSESENDAPLIVLSKKTNDHLFGGQNSVGRQITVGSGKATIVGVIDKWDIQSRLFDGSYSRNRFDDAFIPYQFALNINATRDGYIRCHPGVSDLQIKDYATKDLSGLLNSECTWVNFWARIEMPANAKQYHEFTEQYVTAQKGYGRFPRKIQNYVTNINDQVAQFDLNRWDKKLALLAYLFFFVCVVNAVGMLLAKFLSTSKEVCLRRALGARKKIIMIQYMLEVLLIGIMGGIVGVFMSYGGLQLMKSVRMYATDYTADINVLSLAYQLDWNMIGLAIAVAIGSTLIIGLYPVWRIVNISPASQLKGF